MIRLQLKDPRKIKTYRADERNLIITSIGLIKHSTHCILCFASLLSDNGIFPEEKIQQYLNENIQVFCILDSIPQHPITHPNIIYIIVPWEDFNKDLFTSDMEYYSLIWGDTGSRYLLTQFVNKYQLHILKETPGNTGEFIIISKPIIEPETTKKVLIYRWDMGMGDILMLTACLKSIRAFYKDYTITFGCLEPYKDILINNPYVDEIITEQYLVKRRKFDVVFDFTRFFEHENYPMTSYPATGKCRIDLMYEDKLKIPAVDRRPIYFITPEEEQWAKNQLKKYRIAGKKVGFHVDANGFSRNLPIEYFTNIVNYLNLKEITSILLGGSSRVGKTYNKLSLPGLINLTNLTLRQSAAIINEMDLMVTVDSGLLHLSAAIGKQTIALFGNIRPTLRILYYDTVEELYPAGEYNCIPCNDALYIKACYPACLSLARDSQPSLCQWRLTPEKITTKILMDLNLLPSRDELIRPKLSFAMMTHNEEQWIGQCLSKIHDISDEIIIIDDSTDNTRKIASKFKKVKIYDVENLPCPKECGYCKNNGVNLKEIGRPCSAKLRQQSFDKCTGDWIFRIDADEILRKEDAIKLRNLVDYADILFPSVKIFWFTTVNFFLDDNNYKVGEQGHVWFPDVHKRLHRNEQRFHKWVEPAHERMVCESIFGEVTYLDNFHQFPFMHISNWFYVYHYGYLQPRKDRDVDSLKYKKMKVLLHNLNNSNIEPWVYKKPQNIKLPKGWGTGICEYDNQETG